MELNFVFCELCCTSSKQITYLNKFAICNKHFICFSSFQKILRFFGNLILPLIKRKKRQTPHKLDVYAAFKIVRLKRVVEDVDPYALLLTISLFYYGVFQPTFSAYSRQSLAVKNIYLSFTAYRRYECYA